MRELVKPVIVCAYCKASFDSTELCNLHVELEKHCRQRRRRLTRRARKLLKQRTREDDDSQPGVNHVEEQAFNLVGGNPVEEERELKEKKDDDSKIKVDKQSKKQPIRIKINLGSKKQVMSSIVDRVESSKMTRPSKAVSSSEAEEIDLEEEGVIESVDESSFNLVCPQNQDGFWVTFDKSLLDTFHAGLCFNLTNDGQV